MYAFIVLGLKAAVCKLVDCSIAHIAVLRFWNKQYFGAQVVNTLFLDLVSH